MIGQCHAKKGSVNMDANFLQGFNLFVQTDDGDISWASEQGGEPFIGFRKWVFVYICEISSLGYYYGLLVSKLRLC